MLHNERYRACRRLRTDALCIQIERSEHKKLNERSESIVAFELQQVLAKNCPELSKAKLKRPSEARA